MSSKHLIENLSGPLQDARNVNDEINEAEDDIQTRHALSVAVLYHFGRRRTPHPAEYWRHNPVKGCSKKILPLEPNRRNAGSVHRPGQTHRHIGMGSDAETLRHHEQLAEPPLTQKVVVCVLDP